MDFILNGIASGDVAQRLMVSNMDPHALRPWIGNDGRSYVSMNRFNAQTGKNELISIPLTGNAQATLRRDDWIAIDNAVVRAALPRLRLVADLRAAGLTYGVAGGMAKTVLETTTQSDISDADVSMNGLRQTERDRPVFDTTNLPLPIIHKDFSFSLRDILASRQGGSPLDTSMAADCARKVAEQAEKMHIGVSTAYKYGGGYIYGLTTFPSRNTQILTNPTASSWTPKKFCDEVRSMKAKSVADSHYGPWVLYVSTEWDQYLDDDYAVSGGNNPNQTLRARVAQIDGIQAVRSLDYLTGYQVVLVQMTDNVIRTVNALDITTLQWETHGGMEINFKVMGIMVPQLRADFTGKSGIVHGNTA